jgi:hypothetical protein
LLLKSEIIGIGEFRKQIKATNWQNLGIQKIWEFKEKLSIQHVESRKDLARARPTVAVG